MQISLRTVIPNTHNFERSGVSPRIGTTSGVSPRIGTTSGGWQFSCEFTNNPSSCIFSPAALSSSPKMFSRALLYFQAPSMCSCSPMTFLHQALSLALHCRFASGGK
uniref:Uncharacterized protein n=1 Tax=Setaria viridis TaxID=4556 RepID=A0A4U6V8R0_SETVI|nr:hypothetical protein SEVIR_3G078900v2 [Setaria viridis]